MLNEHFWYKKHENPKTDNNNRKRSADDDEMTLNTDTVTHRVNNVSRPPPARGPWRVATKPRAFSNGCNPNSEFLNLTAKH